MRKSIDIGPRTIGEDEDLFLIAECGVTCNYDMKITKGLIDAVADAGADAIKFIFWFPDEIMSDRTVEYTYETVDGTVTEDMYEMLRELTFSLEEWKEVKDHADDRGVVLFATVNSPTGVAWAEELGLDAYKLSSWDYNHHPLWRDISEKGKPMLIDTGPVTTTEVAKVMDLMREAGNDQSCLLHCYHTSDPAQVNMRAIPFMRDTFDTLVGFSSKDYHDEPDVMAVTMGACVLEKRLTLDRGLPGHHHVISKEPDEFADWVERVHDVRAMLGRHDLVPSEEDLRERREYFRRIVAATDIPAGTELTEEMLAGKRPERGGVSPEYLDLFVGRTTKRDLEENEPLSWDDV